MEWFDVDSKGPERSNCWGCGTQRNIKVCEQCKGYKFCAICYDRYHSHPKRINHCNSKIIPRRLPVSVGHRIHVSSDQRNDVDTAVGHRSDVSSAQQNDVFNCETWICSHCTLENSKAVHICEVCGKTNPVYLTVSSTVRKTEKSSVSRMDIAPSAVAEPAQIGRGTTWTCAHCTFINQMSSQICEVCSKTDEIYLQKQNMMVNTSMNEETPNAVKRKHDWSEDYHWKRERKYEAEHKTMDRFEMKNVNKQQQLNASNFNRDSSYFPSSSSSGTENKDQTYNKGNVNYNNYKSYANICKSNKVTNDVSEKSETNKIDKNHVEDEFSALELAGFISKINFKESEDVTLQNTEKVEIGFENANHVHSKDVSTIEIDISHQFNYTLTHLKPGLSEAELQFIYKPQGEPISNDGPKQIETREQSSTSTKKESKRPWFSIL